MAAIKEAGAAKKRELDGMDQTGAIEQLRSTAEKEAKAKLASFIEEGLKNAQADHPGEMISINALPGYAEAIAAYNKAMEAAGATTIRRR